MLLTIIKLPCFIEVRDGFSQDKEKYTFWGRPAYIAQLPDGSLLVSDEQVGAIYRISYEDRGSAAKKL